MYRPGRGGLVGAGKEQEREERDEGDGENSGLRRARLEFSCHHLPTFLLIWFHRSFNTRSLGIRSKNSASRHPQLRLESFPRQR